MKLATLNDGTRDGKLLVVDRNLSTAKLVPTIANTMQAALDDWRMVKPKLEKVYNALNSFTADDVLSLADINLAAPLPRAYQWADGSAYVNHVELVRKARGATLPENFWHDPLLYQGGSDQFLSATDNIELRDEAYGYDFEAEVAVVLTDVPMMPDDQTANESIALLMLVNDISLRNLIPDELAKGFGFFQSKPASSCSMVVVTPDELGDFWQDTKVHLPLETYLNGQLFGKPNAGVDMTFNFRQLIQHAAKTRQLGAGTILGSGTVSNYDKSLGSSCIAEKRMLEFLEHGKITTPFLKDGDEIRMQLCLPDHTSIFGCIHQKVTAINK